jgi:hypothetical protein
MKVKKLIELLSEHNPEREVVVSSDDEGNEFSPLDNRFKLRKMISFCDNKIHDCVIIYPKGFVYEVLVD